MQMGLLRTFGFDVMGAKSPVKKPTKLMEDNMETISRSNIEAEEMQEMNGRTSMERTKSRGSLVEDDYFDGPDTSSFVAFLISLLSSSPQRRSDDDCMSSHGGSDDEEEVEADDCRISSGESPSGQRSWFSLGLYRNSAGHNAKVRDSKREDGDWIREVDPASGAQRLVKRNAGMSLFDSGSDAKQNAGVKLGEDVEADWHLVFEGDLAHSKSVGSSQASITPRLDPLKTPKTPRSPIKLPEMSEESQLLTEESRLHIYDALPALAKGREWVLLYSTIKHGMSLLTLYRRSELASGPCLLVVGDKEGGIFGGLSSGPLKPSTKKKYQGTSECFVFTNTSGSTQLFRSTGANRYFVLCMNDALALGGGGHFALCIDGDLLHGTTGQCETFGNGCLAKSEDFTVQRVELWGFAHTSRYAPKASTWHEPEVAPGIHTW